MFVEALKRQNPALISAALSLWQHGKIAPDSWVIDVDQVLENGKRLIETARLYGIELYLMTKQFGRNPWLAEKLLALGYSGIVAVDYKEARVMRRAGLSVAHQGIWYKSLVIRLLTPLNRAPTSSPCLLSTKRGKFLRQR